MWSRSKWRGNRVKKPSGTWGVWTAWTMSGWTAPSSFTHPLANLRAPHSFLPRGPFGQEDDMNEARAERRWVRRRPSSIPLAFGSLHFRFPASNFRSCLSFHFPSRRSPVRLVSRRLRSSFLISRTNDRRERSEVGWEEGRGRTPRDRHPTRWRGKEWNEDDERRHGSRRSEERL